MNHRELEYKFIEFLLKEKGYNQKNFLLEASLRDSLSDENKSARYIADLILLDTDYNNYLALVEFKSYQNNSQATSQQTVAQVKKYLSVIGDVNIPGYLVIPSNENEFTVYLLDNNDWKEIEKNDFPHYDSLRSKNQADEKRFNQDLSKEKANELKKKRDLFRNTALSTLMSLVVGIVSVFVLSKKVFSTEDKSNIDKTKIINDSLQIQSNDLKSKIIDIKKELLAIKAQDSILVNSAKNLKINLLDERIKIIENILSNSPERILKLQELTYQLKSVNDQLLREKEINDIKIVNIKDRMDQLTLWTSGLIITILGSIIGFAINAFRK
jgi:Type I restriction enzyme R protein N terminus (HSDR_N)